MPEHVVEPVFLSGLRVALRGFRTGLVAFAALYATAGTQVSAQVTKVAGLLAKLSDEQKAGQLIMGWTRSEIGAGSERIDKMQRLVTEGKIGGVILSIGTRAAALEIVSRLRYGPHAIPVLFAADFESGVGHRLRDGLRFGSAMAIGAGGLARLARAAANATAHEARSLSVRMNFAPVADVNNNADNPIINLRSFGSDPRLVSHFVRASIEGCQAAGVWAVAKHFPGHGDTTVDSHLALPVLSQDLTRLQEVELRPFRAAIEAKARAIMIGHLAVPALDGSGVPATLSAPMLQGWLRGKLGFKGLIVSDALNMRGLTRNAGAGDVAVDALRAGVDLLLMPDDPVAVVAALVGAVRDGQLSRRRLDDACAAVLTMKISFGMGAENGPQLTAQQRAGYEALAQEIAQRAMTLVQDPQGFLPRQRTQLPLLLQLYDAASQDDNTGREFARVLAGGQPLQQISLPANASVEAVAAAAARLDLDAPLLVAIHTRVREKTERLGLPANMAAMVDRLRRHRRLLVVAFGSPYVLAGLPRDATMLCTFDEGVHSERAAARAICGQAAITGRLPVPLPAIAAHGAGESRFLPALRATARPGASIPAATEEGAAADLQKKIEALLEAAVRRHLFPGAVAMVSRRGRLLAEVAVGRHTYEPSSPAVTTETIYDLASLTKVCATLPILLRLIDAGKLSLDDHLTGHVKAFAGGDKGRVTLRQVMAHCAGLAAHAPFFREHSGQQAILEAACRLPLESTPGRYAVYSDLGPMLLGACAEAVSGKSLPVLFKELVAQPLGLQNAGFGAGSDSARTFPAVPPTEQCTWRKRLIAGEVHDENAFAMGGAAGHAGLFASAADVLRIGHWYLGGGEGGSLAALLRNAQRPQELVASSSRGLLLDTFEDGFGHTGFTGTMLWCHPRFDLCVVLLSNRVHPRRDSPHSYPDGMAGLRQHVRQTVVSSIEEWNILQPRAAERR